MKALLPIAVFVSLATVVAAQQKAEKNNMELVGYNDLQARSAYQPTIHRQGQRWIAYVGHHGGSQLNPLTGKQENNGTSIVDVTDPKQPKYVAHIPGEPVRPGPGESGGAQMTRVCDGSQLPRADKNKVYLLRSFGNSSHEVWDVTDPAKPNRVTVVVSGLRDTHKSWWECDTGIAFLVSGLPDWRTRRMTQIYDLSDPSEPVFIRNFGLPGQQPGSTGAVPTDLHGAISTGPKGNRLYFGYFHPYGDPGGSTVLPAGTYWITSAQAQKHWIQSMLNEETWIPFDVTYDVTAWSNPLLMNLEGGWSGDDVTTTAAAEVVGEVAAPEWALDAPSDLKVLLLENERSTRGYESANQTAYLFRDVWGLAFDHVVTADFTTDIVGADLLDDYDVIVLPDGFPNYAVQDFGAKGKRALRDWVNEGGRLVAWQGGALVATKAGISTAHFSTSNTNAPGALVRVSLDDASPLAAGVGDLDWVMYQDDDVMRPGLGTAAATFPASSDDAFATSGLTLGISALAGTAAVSDEAVGAGRVVSFSFDPNFRAWSQGTQRLLWNAIVGADPAGFGAAPLAGSKARAAAEKAAQDAAAAVIDFGSAIRIRVGIRDAAATAKILSRHGAEIARIDLGREVLFLVANRKDLAYEEHPYFGNVVRDLEKAGIDVRAASLP